MSNAEKRQVVISGAGPVSPIGISREEFSNGLRAGANGIRPVTGFDVEGLPSSLAAEALGLKIESYLRSAKNYLDRNSELAFAACELALRDAAVVVPLVEPPAVSLVEPDRFAVCTGSEWGNTQTMAAFADKLREKGPRFVPPFIFPHTYPNTTASLLTIEYGMTGYNEVFFGSSVSGALGVAAAARVIRSGGADVALAGGADAICAPIYRGYALSGLLSPSKGGGVEGCRPFGSDRNGPVLGEAAAFLVLEEAEHCLLRGRKPLAVIAAEAISGDLLDAMRRALSSAAVETRSVSAIFASANGDPDGDEREMSAIRELFGAQPPRIVTLKSQIGDCMGAFGPVNIIAAAILAPGETALVNCADENGNAVAHVIRPE